MIERGGVTIGDAFKVKMSVREKKHGSIHKNHYKVIEVVNSIWAQETRNYHLDNW